MRWIRNRLVHETESFEDNLVSVKDIEWLHTFYCRIMEGTDPFSLLHRSENAKGKMGKQQKRPEIAFSTDKATSSQKKDLQNGVLLIGILLAGILLFGIIIFGSVCYLNFLGTSF